MHAQQMFDWTKKWDAMLSKERFSLLEQGSLLPGYAVISGTYLAPPGRLDPGIVHQGRRRESFRLNWNTHRIARSGTDAFTLQLHNTLSNYPHIAYRRKAQDDMADVNTELDIVPATPNLGRIHRSGGKVRGFGRDDYHRFRNLSPWYICAAEKNIGAVHVDCRLLLKKSKLGVFGFGVDEQPGGIIYFNLDISQPPDCSLSEATIEITFDQESGFIRQHYAESTSTKPPQIPVQVATWGPTKLTGEKRTLTVESSANGTASIQFPGGGIGGVGLDKKRTVERCSRWALNSSLVRGKTGKLYQGVKWTLAANKFDKGSRPGGNLYTAFSFQYDGEPFLMKVKIGGKLDLAADRMKDKGRRLGRTLKKYFGPRPGHAEDICTTRVGSISERGVQLDDLADGLEREMEMENLINGVPIEIPDAQTADFFAVKDGREPTDDCPAETDQRSSHETPRKDQTSSHGIGRHAQWPRAPQVAALQKERECGGVSRDDGTAPTLSNLFDAEQRYFRPPAIPSGASKSVVVLPVEAAKSEGEGERGRRGTANGSALQGVEDGRDIRPQSLETMAKEFGLATVRLLLQLLGVVLGIDWQPWQKAMFLRGVSKEAPHAGRTRVPT
ncbi:hypothetical protein Purlil1_5184 [Purpureocillium lilacinum]|uniref:Uncharacterized protein n=1 Tax=Purpureocillium lilacinum TaxID=33203 RepID=A0ABR0C2H4_PURLI|nr:hypothetical protein Purlil1_5184 [Purpureocillium lilacinum]